MDAAFIFWEKYLNNQVETTWDEFSHCFNTFLTQYGSITLDEEQLLHIKSLIDPDYRNVIKITDYLIFHESYWKTQSNRQALFKHQFKTPLFQIPKQQLRGILLKVMAITHGYPEQVDDILITRTNANIKTLKQEEIFTIGSSKQCDMQIQQDLQLNPKHIKIIWTPYNLFLIQDISKSFRSAVRIDKQYTLDVHMVIRLCQDTVFKVKYLQPLPKIRNQIQTYQESLQNQIPDLLKKMHLFRSVSDYRNHHTTNPEESQEELKLIIEFIEGPLKGQEYLLTKQEYSLGSGKNCSICIPDRMLQREHCTIKQDNGNWIISHKSSDYLDATQFGTFVLLPNSIQYELNLPSKPQIMFENDMFIIGPALFKINHQY